jgi:hypothetical protein
MQLRSEDIKKIEALLTDHREGMSRSALMRKYGFRCESMLSSFFGTLRKLRIDVPTSPNLKNGGKRILGGP